MKEKGPDADRYLQDAINAFSDYIGRVEAGEDVDFADCCRKRPDLEPILCPLSSRKTPSPFCVSGCSVKGTELFGRTGPERLLTARWRCRALHLFTRWHGATIGEWRDGS